MPCSCCAGEALDIFTEKGARKQLRGYLESGLAGDDAKLIARWAEEGGLDGATVLEVGGGIGLLQAELLRLGAAQGTVVEVVDAYAPVAAELARDAGVADRSRFVLADLVTNGAEVDAADVVILRRVVCCSPDGPALLGASAARTERVLLASYPRDAAWMRVGVAMQNVFLRLIRRRFRVFVHRPAELDAAAATHGLRRARSERGIFWETTAFERSRPAG